MTSNTEFLKQGVIRKVAQEIAALIAEPPEGIAVIPNEENVTDIQATIDGPSKYIRSGLSPISVSA
jgi:ubiquitin-conjugating enzyme E2 S